MTIDIGRRESVAALGGATATWPLAARAPQAMPAWIDLDIAAKERA